MKLFGIGYNRSMGKSNTAVSAYTTVLLLPIEIMTIVNDERSY